MSVSTRPGTLLGIARRARPGDEIETLSSVKVLDSGIEGETRRGGKRQVSVLDRASWEAACAAVGEDRPWTTRRANLLVEGVDLAQSTGRRLRIGDVVLEVTAETDPCELMDRFLPGLRSALEPDWRGGASARVVEAGEIRCGDTVGFED